MSTVKGRGTPCQPRNRFERLQLEPDDDWLESATARAVPTRYYLDHTREILARNNSPDLSFNYSLNPYRGCEHGCVYCYARPTHEYFGWSAGLDFETRILVKADAPELLARAFRSRGWQPQVVALSGNTDCYQPIEKKLEITRRCLQVFLEFRNPVNLITKNALVLRDLDVLRDLARLNLVSVTLSVTTLDAKLARLMEPRTSSPAKRLEALARLTAAGVPTNVNVAPLIPGLNESEMPAILREAAARGVQRAAYILLRLPYGVKELFFSWLERHYPERVRKVRHAVQDTRAGRLNDACFSRRLRGEGVRAETMQRLFELNCRKLGLNQREFALDTSRFRRGGLSQTDLFE